MIWGDWQGPGVQRAGGRRADIVPVSVARAGCLRTWGVSQGAEGAGEPRGSLQAACPRQRTRRRQRPRGQARGVGTRAEQKMKEEGIGPHGSVASKRTWAFVSSRGVTCPDRLSQRVLRAGRPAGTGAERGEASAQVSTGRKTPQTWSPRSQKATQKSQALRVKLCRVTSAHLHFAHVFEISARWGFTMVSK